MTEATPPNPSSIRCHVLDFRQGRSNASASWTEIEGSRGRRHVDASNKLMGAIVAVVLLAGAGYLALNVKSDRAKFEQLRVGMTTSEVQAIVGPKTGRYGRFHTDVGDNDTLFINDVMVLTLRNGRLVD